MLQFNAWKAAAIFGVVLLGLLFAFPNVLSERGAANLPNFVPKSQMNLGLDLQGGVHLQVRVEKDGLVEDRLKVLASDIRQTLFNQNRIGYRSLRARDRSVSFTLRDSADTDAARDLLEPLTDGVTVDGGVFGSVVEVERSEPSPGSFVFTLTEEGIANRVRSAVSQSIEVIRNRVDELGTTEPIIQPQGEDRIIVQVPGFNDPERLKDIIGKVARLTFREVDERANPRAIVEEGAQTPIGYEVLYTDDDPPRPVVVRDVALIDGDALTGATQGFDGQTGEPIVSFQFNTQAALVFGNHTRNNIGNRFAIVLDDTIITDPVIRSAIPGGSGQISGNFTPDSANDLAILMRAGALPADITFVEERTVGPGLGADNIDAGKIAAVVAALAVVVFMLFAYGLLGVIANLALAANLVLIVASLTFLGATLTLPGIAGIVLTMGMAVDANVLIYERIREERHNGRSFRQAIDVGFKQALATILDANITTLIAAAILFYLGSGPIKGFAVTLAIGIVTSVFTAYTLTRLMIGIWVQWKRPTELPRRWISLVKEETSLAFMKFRRLSFPGSALALVASLALFVVLNLNYGIDFRGGSMLEYRAKAPVADIADIRSRLGELNLGDVQVQEFGTPQEVLIRIEGQGAGDNAEQSAIAKVRAVMDPDHDFRRQEVVGPTVSGELAQAGTLAVLAALVAIMGYIWLRFEWQFAIGAVLATAHDVILTIGMFALLQIEFELASIAAILTIVGYSLNDTVVVYDRIRENLRKYKKMPIPQLLDLSINNTLSRTILTSVTTLIALIALYVLGGEALRGFVFAMIFGIVIGTYSSIFIAAPLLILFKLRPGALDRQDVSPYAGKEAVEAT